MWNNDEPGSFVFSAMKVSSPLQWEDIKPLDAKELLDALGDPIEPYMLRQLKVSPQDYWHLERLRSYLRSVFDGGRPPLEGSMADQIAPLQQADSPLISNIAARFIDACRALSERKAGLGTGGLFLRLSESFCHPRCKAGAHILYRPPC